MQKKNQKLVLRDIQGEALPRLRVLSHVPLRYSQVLPLAVMKRYQCVVIGRSHDELTLAIAYRQSMTVFDTLSALTGCRIFPVLVNPVHMQLVLKRIERTQKRLQHRHRKRSALSLYPMSMDVHAMLLCLLSRKVS